jgi:hypothetical protein
MKSFVKTLILSAIIIFVALPLAKVVYGKDLVSTNTHSYSLPRFHYGRLKCAQNVNSFLRHIGKRGTNSLSAVSFLAFQKVSVPKFGDVVFNWRGKGKGHAQIYISNGMCINPRQNIGWRKVPCNSVWRNKRKIYLRVK